MPEQTQQTLAARVKEANEAANAAWSAVEASLAAIKIWQREAGPLGEARIERLAPGMVKATREALEDANIDARALVRATHDALTTLDPDAA